MANSLPIPASQQLRDVAKAQETALIGTNTYKENSFEYNANNPNALSDGDDKGKGETQTVGSKTDIQTRTQNLGVNQFSPTNEYKSPE